MISLILIVSLVPAGSEMGELKTDRRSPLHLMLYEVSRGMIMQCVFSFFLSFLLVFLQFPNDIV